MLCQCTNKGINYIENAFIFILVFSCLLEKHIVPHWLCDVTGGLFDLIITTTTINYSHYLIKNEFEILPYLFLSIF